MRMQLRRRRSERKERMTMMTRRKRTGILWPKENGHEQSATQQRPKLHPVHPTTRKCSLTDVPIVERLGVWLDCLPMLISIVG